MLQAQQTIRMEKSKFQIASSKSNLFSECATTKFHYSGNFKFWNMQKNPEIIRKLHGNLKLRRARFDNAKKY